MRPGFVFVALFVLLVAVYFVFQNTLGFGMTLALQVAIVLALLGLALWLKKQFAPPDK